MNIIAMKPSDIAYDGRKKELILSFFKELHHSKKLRKKSDNYEEGVLVPRDTCSLIKMLKYVDMFYAARSLTVAKAIALITKTKMPNELEMSIYTHPETPQEFVDLIVTRIHNDYEKAGKTVTMLLM